MKNCSCDIMELERYGIQCFACTPQGVRCCRNIYKYDFCRYHNTLDKYPNFKKKNERQIRHHHVQLVQETQTEIIDIGDILQKFVL